MDTPILYKLNSFEVFTKSTITIIEFILNGDLYTFSVSLSDEAILSMESIDDRVLERIKEDIYTRETSAKAKKSHVFILEQIDSSESTFVSCVRLVEDALGESTCLDDYLMPHHSDPFYSTTVKSAVCPNGGRYVEVSSHVPDTSILARWTVCNDYDTTDFLIGEIQGSIGDNKDLAVLFTPGVEYPVVETHNIEDSQLVIAALTQYDRHMAAHQKMHNEKSSILEPVIDSILN